LATGAPALGFSGLLVFLAIDALLSVAQRRR
jgi:hypothetical protein